MGSVPLKLAQAAEEGVNQCVCVTTTACWWVERGQHRQLHGGGIQFRLSTDVAPGDNIARVGPHDTGHRRPVSCRDDGGGVSALWWSASSPHNLPDRARCPFGAHSEPANSSACSPCTT